MSLFATLPATISAAVLETILPRLAALFLSGAGGDMTVARQAGIQMLAAHRPDNENELRLAANVIIFSFQALEALGQAAAPDLPITRVLRLRSGAVSLSRESANAERRLTQLQKARQQPTQAQPFQAQSIQAQSIQAQSIQAQRAQDQPAETRPEPAQPAPKIEKAVALVNDTATIAKAAKANGQTWTQAYEQHQREARIAASIKRAEAKVAAQAAAAIPLIPAQPTAPAA